MRATIRLATRTRGREANKWLIFSVISAKESLDKVQMRSPERYAREVGLEYQKR